MELWNQYALPAETRRIGDENTATLILYQYCDECDTAALLTSMPNVTVRGLPVNVTQHFAL